MKKSILNGLITIDMYKFENTTALVSYVITYILQKVFIFLSIIMGFGMISAGGDGKYSDGNIKAVIICLLGLIVCAFLSRVFTVLMETICENSKQRNIERKANKRNAQNDINSYVGNIR